MTALVSHSEHVADYVVLVVQENVWVACVAARRKCAASFAFVLVAVNPTVFETIAENVRVRFSQGAKGGAANFNGFVVASLAFNVFYERNVNVVVAQLVNLERALADRIVFS